MASSADSGSSSSSRPRAGGQRAGQRDAPLLAAGELRWVLTFAARQAHQLDQLAHLPRDLARGTQVDGP